MLTPAHRLNHFAMSVDTIDDQAYQVLLDDLVRHYLLGTLKASFYSGRTDGVRIDADDGPRPGLKTFWSSREGDETVPVFRSDDDTYNGQLAYAYHRGKSLWITAPDGGPLSEAEPGSLVDSWSGCDDLPEYRTPDEDSNERTSIIVPLRYAGRVFGVIDVEFEKHHEYSVAARDEFKQLVEALARIVWLHETTKSATRATHGALEVLKQEFATVTSPLERPSFFVASPSNAEQDAVEAMMDLVHEFEDTYTVIPWDKMSASGNINQQVSDAITACHLGIFYLSDAAGGNGDGPKYVDNPNVLFEAGMLHALKDQPGARPVSWIVIREQEKLAGPIPFDLASERMVIVPRDDDGTLRADDFTVALRSHIEASLDAV